MMIVCGSFLAQWVWLSCRILCSFSKWDGCQLSPWGLAEMTAVRCWKGGNGGTGLSIQLVGGPGSQSHYLPHCIGSCNSQQECSGGWEVNWEGCEPHFVLLRQALTIRISPGLGCWHYACLTDFAVCKLLLRMWAHWVWQALWVHFYGILISIRQSQSLTMWGLVSTMYAFWGLWVFDSGRVPANFEHFVSGSVQRFWHDLVHLISNSTKAALGPAWWQSG